MVVSRIALPLHTHGRPRPRPGRRVGLVCRSSAGRDAAYRRLAAIIADLVVADGAARHDDESASGTI